METLLVPTNFTTISNNALDYAIGLAKKLKAKITLLHIDKTFPTDSGLINKEYKKEAKKIKKQSEVKLKEHCEEIKSTSSIKCDYVSYEGLAKDIIVEYANKRKPDLLIIGTEELLPIERIIYGTITGKVIKETTCPLLVIPENAEYAPPKKIAFAMDYHDSDLKEIEFVEKLAKKFKSETHIIHVITTSENEDFEENYFTLVNNEIKKNNAKNKISFNLIKGKNIIEELEKYIKEEHIDILAVAKTKKTPLEQLFSESISQKLFYRTNMPLLIFKAEDVPADFI